MKKIGIISCLLAILVIACTITAVIPISAESNSPDGAWIKGDTNGDGLVTIIDATVIQRYLAHLAVLDEERVKRCGDINNNGIDIIDATIIQRYLAKLTVAFDINVPIEEPTEEPTQEPTVEVTGPAFIVEKVNADSSDTDIAVNVLVKNNPGISSIALDIVYDKDVLELTGFTYNTEALGGASTTPYNSSARVPCLFMVNGTQNINGDFTFATLHFKVKDKTAKTCPITVTYDEDNVYDISEENIDFQVIDGAIVLGGEETTAPTEATAPTQQSGKHTVVFKDYDGTVLSSQTVNDGEAAQAPANPERDGYTFAGWNTAFDSVKSDLEIMALYEENSTSPAFVVDKVYAHPGDDNIAVTVMVRNNPGISAIALDIMYDKSALTLKDFTYNTAALSGASVTPFNANAYQPTLFMVNGTKNIDGDFLFATMYFDVADNASGTYPISLVYDEDNVYNIDEDNVWFDVVNGFINVN